MVAQALYLKYRPQTFKDVAGQAPITRTLRNALRQGKVRHAYLFTGPRGTGKTTTARLLAKAVNCRAPEEERPCNECPICVAINEGRLLDLIEIDAASNRGIDEIRDIREKVNFRPNEGRYKVYVLDEAHMLTEPAFNALLKTLEEPPPHVIFVLVTTDPHKIPATISSRCQRFDFRRIPLQVLVDRLAYIAGQEGVTVEPEALELIAHHGTGAMRDAISLLDQLTSYGDEITLAQVQMVLGTVASEAAGKVVSCLVEGDVAGGLDLINRTVADGADPRQFGREVVEYLRGLLLLREGAGTRLLSATSEQAAEMETLAQGIAVERLLAAIRLFNQATTDLKRGLQTIPQLPLEMALVESALGPPPSQASGQPLHQQQVAYQTTARPGPATGQTAAGPSASTSPTSVGKTPASAGPAPTAVETAAASAGTTSAGASTTAAVSPSPGTRTGAATASRAAPVSGPESTPQAQAGTLTLSQVERAWGVVLQAVRQRNPATQAALNTGCQPVEVNGDELVITFPYPVLREKLSDAQRRAEIQDALTEVLHARCRITLVLASDYTPRPQAPTPSQPPQATQEAQAAVGESPDEDPGDAGASDDDVAADHLSNEGAPADRPPSGNPSSDETSDEKVAEAITRWAEQHGGQAKIIPS